MRRREAAEGASPMGPMTAPMERVPRYVEDASVRSRRPTRQRRGWRYPRWTRMAQGHPRW